VINIRDGLTFQGRTLDELRTAFADAEADDTDLGDRRGSGQIS